MLGSALGSAQSAIAAAETQLQVSAHNVANLQTTGFKASRVGFASAGPQTITSATSPGGANLLQVGHGTRVASIDSDASLGSIAPNGNPRSFAIVGAGYFVLGDANSPVAYSRDGNFYWNAAGDLVHGSGLLAWGHSVGASPEGGNGLAPLTLRPGMLTGNTAESVRISEQGQVTSLQPDGSTLELGSLAIAQFTNPQGLQAVGDNLYTAGPTAGSPQFSAPNSASLRLGSRELSNTNVAGELVVMLMAATMVRANVAVVQVNDELLQEVSSLLAS